MPFTHENLLPPFDDVQSASAVRFVPIDRIRTTLLHLRPGAPHMDPERIADLPIRVAFDGDHFEVIDGFKRLERWREAKHTHVPVVIEAIVERPEQKRLLLVANAPKRTITALDEAYVVASLIQENGLSARAVARLLQRKIAWVVRRFAIATQCSERVRAQIASGAMGLSLAFAMTLLSVEEQNDALTAIEKHHLRPRDAHAFVHTFRVADEVDRRNLLHDPLDALAQHRSLNTTSPRARDLEGSLFIIEDAIAKLTAFTIPDDLAPAETRRVDAIHRRVVGKLKEAARLFEPKHHEENQDVQTPKPEEHKAQWQTEATTHRSSKRDARRDPSPSSALRDTIDRGTCGAVSLCGSTNIEGDPVDSRSGIPRTATGPKAQPVRGSHSIARRKQPDDYADLPRDPVARLHRWPNDPLYACPETSRRDRRTAEEERQEALRNAHGT